MLLLLQNKVGNPVSWRVRKPYLPDHSSNFLSWQRLWVWGNNSYLFITRLAGLRIILMAISVNKIIEKRAKRIKDYLRLVIFTQVQHIIGGWFLLILLQGFSLSPDFLSCLLIILLVPKGRSSLYKSQEDKGFADYINNELIKWIGEHTSGAGLSLQKGFNPTLLQLSKLSPRRVLVMSLMALSFKRTWQWRCGSLTSLE